MKAKTNISHILVQNKLDNHTNGKEYLWSPKRS